MSANSLLNLSNESPAPSSNGDTDNEDAPPPFESKEPPSFPLSVALEEATQQHPPVSPGTATWIFNMVWRDYPPSNQPLSTQEAKDLLLKNDNLSTTIHAMAYGLISTIHHHTTQFTQQLRESKQHVLAQRELVAQHDEEILLLRSQPRDIRAPTGFLPNKGRINCIIPTTDGALVVPRFVRCRGSGQVEMVVGRECNEAVYMSDIYLAPNYSHILTDPMGVWFLQLLGGPTAGFNALAEALHEL